MPRKKWRSFNFIVEVAVESPGAIEEEEAAEDAADFCAALARTAGRAGLSYVSIVRIREFDFKSEASFIAGLIVGEGSFYLSGQKDYRSKLNKNKYYIRPGFTVSMTDTETIARVVCFFDYYNIPYTLKEEKRSENSKSLNKKILWGIQVTGNRGVSKVINLFLPWLFGQKLISARLVREFILSREKRKGHTYDEIELRIVDKLHELQGRKKVSLATRIREAKAEGIITASSSLVIELSEPIGQRVELALPRGIDANKNGYQKKVKKAIKRT